ncbi:MAG: excinuclease ABC subunit UvrA [Bacteroidetes bacterium]|nr:excinuclease ABC subunit UvrA [Bacteroidota bacterium]
MALKKKAGLPDGGIAPIVIRGANVHNLKNISLALPREKLIVFTGVSGSGKSSLAFDTIYAEGQRRYVESLSSYARQFLERMEKPDVESIQGMSPAIAIEQKTLTRNPRSTVATTTEVYDYLRLLFGRVGKTYCPICGSNVRRDTVTSIIDTLKTFQSGTKLYILFPLRQHPGRTIEEECSALRARGFTRVFYQNEIYSLDDSTLPLPGKNKGISLSVVVDRLALNWEKSESVTRLADSLQIAFTESNGYAEVYCVDTHKYMKFSQYYTCEKDNVKFEEPEPRLFSFNNPLGACPTCQGFGRTMGIDLDLVIPDPSKSLRDGAVVPWTLPRWSEYYELMLETASRLGIPVNVPFQNLTDDQKQIIIEGYGQYKGINGFFEYLEKKSFKLQYRVLLSRYRGYTVCPTCKGARLRPELLNVRIAGKSIHDIVQMSITTAKEFFENLSLEPHEQHIARRILEELKKRLTMLDAIGLGYLTLDRLTMTLSGGESQRLNLATSLGSALVGAVYVLDEPTIGLHPRDNARLIAILKSLRDLGNTVLVVEHDEEMIQHADVIVDLGPRAGEHGGEIIFQGTYSELLTHPVSLTAKYLRKELAIPLPQHRRHDSERSLYIYGATEHNLKNIDVRIPLHMFVCITGVSGSGKSTLVHDVLYANIRKYKGEPVEGTVGKCKAIEGIENISHVELVDQTPIGRTSRSNPATFLKAFDEIRELLANTPAARTRGFTPGTFSFNVPGGRCDVCEGEGVQVVDMQFLADITLPCESCKGKRFKREVLEIRYRGKNVDDLLSMTVTEALQFFSESKEGARVVKRLQILDEVGLGYLRLGQSATTLSGGEAQRMKLAYHLSQTEEKSNILFIFDEPTTGLHFDDIAKLLRCFDRLLEHGHSLLVIEHNLHVIKCADYIIDLGPDAGEKGGSIVAMGTPEDIARNPRSVTGEFLKRVLIY